VGLRESAEFPTDVKGVGSVPFPMKVGVESSAWHHQKRDIGDHVEASRPSTKEHDR
jgi:hypothetical protein